MTHRTISLSCFEYAENKLDQQKTVHRMQNKTSLNSYLNKVRSHHNSHIFCNLLPRIISFACTNVSHYCIVVITYPNTIDSRKPTHTQISYETNFRIWTCKNGSIFPTLDCRYCLYPCCCSALQNSPLIENALHPSDLVQ